jgi:hypothetical protein
MRGTCFYILGLLSRTELARLRLAPLGWQFSPHKEAGIVVPSDANTFLAIPNTAYAGSWANDKNNVFGVKSVPSKPKPDDKARSEEDKRGVGEPASAYERAANAHLVLGHISNLCNHVTQKSSLQALRNLQRDHRSLFTSTCLFFETLKLLGNIVVTLL